MTLGRCMFCYAGVCQGTARHITATCRGVCSKACQSGGCHHLVSSQAHMYMCTACWVSLVKQRILTALPVWLVLMTAPPVAIAKRWPATQQELLCMISMTAIGSAAALRQSEVAIRTRCSTACCLDLSLEEGLASLQHNLR